MTLYLLLKLLHILCSVLLLGTGLGCACYALRAWRSGQVALVASSFRRLVRVDWLIIVPTAIFLPLSGLGLARLGGWPLNHTWLLGSVGLLALAGLCWLPVLWLQMRVRNLSAEALRNGESLPARAGRYLRIRLALGWPPLLALLVIFWLMAVKPL